MRKDRIYIVKCNFFFILKRRVKTFIFTLDLLYANIFFLSDFETVIKKLYMIFIKSQYVTIEISV